MTRTAERRPGQGAAPRSTEQDDHGQRTAGQAGRDEGAAAALDAAWPIWRLEAQEHLEALADAGREFTADDLVDEVGLPPVTGSPNAIGGLFIAAINAGLIVPVGYTRSRRRSRHAGVQRIYRGAPA